jgi:hypothetical protein
VIVKAKVCERIVGLDAMWADPSAGPGYAEVLANVMLKRANM